MDEYRHGRIMRLGIHPLPNEEEEFRQIYDKLVDYIHYQATVAVDKWPDELHLHPICDTHCHLRQDELMENLAATLMATPHYCAFLPMPNTMPILATGAATMAYIDHFRLLSQFEGDLLPTMMLTPQTTPQMIEQATRLGVRAAKLYVANATTNSDEGVPPEMFEAMLPVFRAMETCGMHLLIHGEIVDDVRLDVLDREVAFLTDLRCFARALPRLRITMEHITTWQAVTTVLALGPNITATITPQHLMITQNDVIGGALAPDNHCKPVAKRLLDRAALRMAAMSGNPKFRAGSDSAPHLPHAKYCAYGCAGCFTAPHLPSLYAETFAAFGATDQLDDFWCHRGRAWFDLPANTTPTVHLVRQPWTVPPLSGAFVPFWSGRQLQYQPVRP